MRIGCENVFLAQDRKGDKGGGGESDRYVCAKGRGLLRHNTGSHEWSAPSGGWAWGGATTDMADKWGWGRKGGLLNDRTYLLWTKLWAHWSNVQAARLQILDWDVEVKSVQLFSGKVRQKRWKVCNSLTTYLWISLIGSCNWAPMPAKITDSTWFSLLSSWSKNSW